MRLTVKCPHGVGVEVEDENGDSMFEWSRRLRAIVREALLACPACRRRAEDEIEEPGL